jgi:hypothetical protein
LVRLVSSLTVIPLWTPVSQYPPLPVYNLASPREPHLSASRFAAAVGIHPYTSRMEIWEELTGKCVCTHNTMGQLLFFS